MNRNLQLDLKDKIKTLREFRIYSVFFIGLIPDHLLLVLTYPFAFFLMCDVISVMREKNLDASLRILCSYYKHFGFTHKWRHGLRGREYQWFCDDNIYCVCLRSWPSRSDKCASANTNAYLSQDIVLGPYIFGELST